MADTVVLTGTAAKILLQQHTEIDRVTVLVRGLLDRAAQRIEARGRDSQWEKEMTDGMWELLDGLLELDCLNATLHDILADNV